ncbi:MAG: putative restriction endonuclease [Pedosphaera sp.]|nr:putative restriction endonuclease [Pedosphaera sp.]
MENPEKPGDISRKGQELLRLTGQPGTDHNSKVWILKCLACGHVYGCNSTDAWERKCPHCGGGKAGLELPAERDGEDWTYEEHIIAFSLYNQITFGTIGMRNPKVVELAAVLGRTPGSVSYKLTNFVRFDPSLKTRGIRGNEHGAKGEEQIWKEFAQRPESLAFESARLLAAHLGTSVEKVADIEQGDLPPAGIEREALVRLRVKQSFFRKRILSAYGFRCCVTGITVPSLLVASHIVPWAEDEAHRLNPQNGLCLNALHDRAFDRRLMWIDDGYIIRFSEKLLTELSGPEGSLKWLTSFEGKTLTIPKAFGPDPNLLLRHSKRCRNGNG